MTYVLVASDKFKGSLTAAAVGEAIAPWWNWLTCRDSRSCPAISHR